MDIDEILPKLKGLKAQLYMASNTTDEIEDQQYAFMLMSETLSDVINEIEKSNVKNRE